MKKAEFADLLAGLAEAFDKKLSPFVAEAYYRALSPLGSEVVRKAFYAAIERCERFPTVIKLKELAGVPDDLPVDDEGKAREIVARIKNAVSTFGYYRGEDAEEYLGELGWFVVSQLGGWKVICDYPTMDALDFELARARELAKIYMTKSRRGELGQAPTFDDLPPVFTDIAKIGAKHEQ